MAAEQLDATAVQALLAGGTLAGSWTLDPARSEVTLKTRHTWGLRPVNGHFRQVSGGGTVTADGQVNGVISVAAESVDTKNPQRDKHLRSPDFFHVEQHPEFTFTVTGVSPSGDGATVSGTLTVRGQTRPASFPATVAAAADELTLDGELKVNRTDFGMTWNFLGVAATDNTIVIHAVLTRG